MYGINLFRDLYKAMVSHLCTPYSPYTDEYIDELIREEGFDNTDEIRHAFYQDDYGRKWMSKADDYGYGDADYEALMEMSELALEEI